LNSAAPGPGGSITLTTQGSDIITNGATLEADRGTITIQHTAAPSAGTAQITLDGGAITSETLLASSRGNLSVGATAPVNLSAVTLSLLGTNNVTWNGATVDATAVNSTGNVTVQAGNDISLLNAVFIRRFAGGITDGINLTLAAGGNLQATHEFNLLTSGGGLTSGGNITLTAGGTITTGGRANLQALPNTNQTAGSNISIASGGAIRMASLLATVQISAGRTLGNGGNIVFNAGTGYTATASDGGLDLQVINSSPGLIGTGGNITLTIGGNLTTGFTGLLNLVVSNAAGQIQTGGNITSTVTGTFNAGSINVLIDNSLKGFIGSGAGITFNVGGLTTVTGEGDFIILNFRRVTGGGGTIGSNAFINVTLADASFGALTSFIDNNDGSIGGAGGTVTLQINGTLTVTNRIDVLGTLNSTGAMMAGELSATNVSAPSIAVGAGGITRFSFPASLNEITINPVHTITTSLLTSTGGINFNGPDFNAMTGGPYDGGQLVINVPSLTFGSSAGDNIQGPVTLNGGNSPDDTSTAGSGGSLTVNATGAITVSSPISATSGQRPFNSVPSGGGGTVNLNTTNGTVTVNSPITVSSADGDAPGLPPRRRSASGGTISIQSNVATGVAINVNSTGQLLSLLEAAAPPPPGGKITILATGSDSSINVTGDPGSAGKPPQDTIRADGANGYVDIRHTGVNGTITLTNAQISADILKIGALGDNGILKIGGGRITADTILKLYATGSNGSVMFVSDVFLSANGMMIIAGNSVTVNNNVTVTVGGTGGKAADVYVLDPTKANYSNFNGGNNSTSGKFILDGTAGSPVSGANTHLGMAPPAFGPPGGL
jgi:hypothetical protein